MNDERHDTAPTISDHLTAVWTRLAVQGVPDLFNQLQPDNSLSVLDTSYIIQADTMSVMESRQVRCR